jgi:hypothetical protein
MIQLLARKVLRLGFQRYVYPHMTTGNFNLVWTFLANSFKTLPLRTILSYAMSLGTQHQVVRAMTVERIIEPVLKTQGIVKTEIKNGKTELLVTWLFSLIGFTRFSKFALKVILWIPKLVLTLFFVSLTSIDVSYFQSIINWFTWGFSNSLTLFFSTVWALVVYIYKTGDIINLNFLRNISEPLNLESLFRNKDTKEVKEIITEISNEEHWSKKETWSTSTKNLIRIGTLFVLNVTIKYFLDTTIVSEYLKDHPWLDKGADFFRWTTKFGKDINTVLVDNLPLVGRLEDATSTVVGGALGYGYYFWDKAIITPTKWGWNTATSVFDFGITKPFNSIRSWFNPSAEALEELRRLKEENENLKGKNLRRWPSFTSIGSGVRAWRSKTTSTKPKVNTNNTNNSNNNNTTTTTDNNEIDNPFNSGTNAWAGNRTPGSVPGTPLTPNAERRNNSLLAEPALSTVDEEATPRTRSNDLDRTGDDEDNEGGAEGPVDLPGFEL